jgi:sulfide:quinone oxidoreductase
MTHQAPLRVLVAGGGVAGLETVLALRALAGRRVTITMLAAEPEFVVRAGTVGEPFDRSLGRTVVLAELAADLDMTLIVGRLRAVEPEAHVAITDRGRLSYDVLVVAAGAVPTEPLPGAVTFRGRTDVGDMRAVVDDLVARRARSVAFALPASLSWSLPLYELALLTSARLIGEQVTDAALTVVTPEPGPLAVFGSAGARAMEDALAQRGIALRTHARAVRVEPGRLILADGTSVAADRVVTVPVLEGPRMEGLPADVRGFVPVDRHGAVRTVEDVYAAGDVTSFPLKQGGLAAQQADAVAEAIAARAGAPVEPEPFHPVIRGLLLTGAEPIYLRAEPGADGRPGAPVVRGIPRAASAGSDRPLWWPPAKVAGRYLAPYLSTARPSRLEQATLADRPAPLRSARVAERRAALELALCLADADAGWGDTASALRALDAAEALEGVLPPEYERKRAQWRAATPH